MAQTRLDAAWPEIAAPGKLMESVDEGIYDARYGHHLFDRDGVAYTPDMTRAGIAAIEDAELAPGDISVVGYPKSGTNWAAIIVARLYPDLACNREHDGRIPDLHVPDRPQIGFLGFETALGDAPPRLFKSHAQYRHMPRAFREGTSKVVYIWRNPRDVCESCQNQLAGWLPEGWTWEDHVNAFIHGHVFFGSWLDNVIGWHEHRDDPNVLILSYEEMNRDRLAAVRQIVNFLGPVEPGRIEQVLTETEFSNMQKGDLAKLYQPQMVRREGKSGGWRARFTDEQVAAMDAAFSAPLAAAGIKVDYGEG